MRVWTIARITFSGFLRNKILILFSVIFACVLLLFLAPLLLMREQPQTTSARNRVPGRVRSVILEGPLARVELECGFPLVAMITAQSAAELGLRENEAVSAIVKATSVHITAAGAGQISLP